MTSVRRLAFAAAVVLLAVPTAFAQDASAVAVRKIDRSVPESLKRGGRTMANSPLVNIVWGTGF